MATGTFNLTIKRLSTQIYFMVQGSELLAHLFILAGMFYKINNK